MRSSSLVAVAVLGVLLLTPPLLTVFDRPVLVGGWPLLVAYVFGVWALVVGLSAWAVRGRTPR